MDPRIRAIIIDDDPACRDLLKLLLEQKDYEVISLSNPTACPLFNDAECICIQDRPCGDFLLTDNQMPHMTGLEFVKRQIDRGCKGIVGNKAVLSGTWLDIDLAEAERIGCKVFSKPYKIDRILAWLKEREKNIQPGRKLAVFERNDFD